MLLSFLLVLTSAVLGWLAGRLDRSPVGLVVLALWFAAVLTAIALHVVLVSVGALLLLVAWLAAVAFLADRARRRPGLVPGPRAR